MRTALVVAMLVASCFGQTVTETVQQTSTGPAPMPLISGMSYKVTYTLVFESAQFPFILGPVVEDSSASGNDTIELSSSSMEVDITHEYPDGSYEITVTGTYEFTVPSWAWGNGATLQASWDVYEYGYGPFPDFVVYGSNMPVH